MVFWGLYLIAFLIGTLLRLYFVSHQLLLDDEWHALDYVPGKSLFYLLTHFGSSANCIPLNIYKFLLMKTFGWSELLLKLPSLMAGILSLVLFPIFANRLFGHRTSIIFSFLLAISPVLVFYSRVSRGYAMVAFLGFLSIYFLYMWAMNGQLKFAVLYVITGGFAVYFHLFALITVLVPIGVFFLFSITRTLTGFSPIKTKIVPGTNAIMIVALSLLLFLCFLLGPAVIQSQSPLVPTQDHATLSSLAGVLPLLSGTSNIILLVVFICLLVFGTICVSRQNPLLNSMFLSIILCYFIAMATVHHSGIDDAIEIVRFSISVLPIIYLFVSIGLSNIIKLLMASRLIDRPAFIKLSGNSIIAVFLSALFFTGPLPPLYGHINNFTNHSAFQESYKKKTWEKSYSSEVESGYAIKKHDIPAFYKWLSNQPNVKAIIEYPMLIADHCNLFYYYQHVHGKKVRVGYIPMKINTLKPSHGRIYANWIVDFPLSRIPDESKLRFRNIINMMDIKSLKKNRGIYIILHKDIMAEISRYSKRSHHDPYVKPVILLDRIYRKRLGTPILEDEYLIVFKIH